MQKTLSRAAALLLVALMVFACSHRAVRRHKPPPPKPQRPSTVTAEDRKKISLLLTRQNYDEAMKLMRAKITAGATEQDFSSFYVIAMNGLISTGEAHLKKNERAEAGRAFRRALDWYPADELMRRKLKRSSPDMQKVLNQLSVDMMDAALLKYRAGELEDAIAIWDGLLSFDPENAEARKARDTAKIQLQNLQKMK